jgi:hypothetical protein
MNTDDRFWDELPENLLRLPAPDPALPEEFLDGLLCERPVGTAASPGGLALAELVCILRQPARPDELRGEVAAVAEYLWQMESDVQHARGPRTLNWFVSARVVAATVAGSLVMGGVAAADGSLPDPLQHFAHVVFGAPPAQPNGTDGADSPDGGDPAGADELVPMPMPTESSTQAPRPEEPSEPSAAAVPADPYRSDFALEPGDVTEPDPNPTTGASSSTETTSSGSGKATPTPSPTPSGGQPTEGPAAGPPSSHPTGPPTAPPVPPEPAVPLTQPGRPTAAGRPTGDPSTAPFPPEAPEPREVPVPPETPEPPAAPVPPGG